MRTTFHRAFFLSLLAAAACGTAHASQRAFVSSTGNDASQCTPTAPCRGFARAIAVVDDGGEIVALDAAGYGTVTIAKSVTIAANPGYYAGISAASTAVSVTAPGIKVILRGLNINSTGGDTGVSVAAAASVSIENCVISNFGTAGVYASGSNVKISDSVLRGNNFGVYANSGSTVDVARTRLTYNAYGVYAEGTVDGTSTAVAVSDTIATGNDQGFTAETVTGATGNVTLAVTRSTASGGEYGVYVHKTAGNIVSATLSGNLITHNRTAGIYNGGGSTVETQGNNTVRFNALNTQGSALTAVPGI